jgi:hypothetical protein
MFGGREKEKAIANAFEKRPAESLPAVESGSQAIASLGSVAQPEDSAR